METTRHFTATVYVVEDGATALHEHPRLGVRIPPGGHVGRDELPHEAALREVREETGLTATIVDDRDGQGIAGPAGRELPRPRHQMLYDIDVFDGEVAHQHVDHLYYAGVPDRGIDPEPGEEPAGAWAWYTAADLRAGDLDPDVVALGLEAIEAVTAAAGDVD